MKFTQEPLRVGIVGCGKVAEFHARFIKELPNVHLAGVADINGDAAREFARRHDVQFVSTSIKDLLLSAKLDVLHVVTPPSTHYETAKLALNEGTHVFVEKPLAFSAHEVVDLYERADDRGVLLCPDFIQLFHPKMQELIRTIESGRLGRILHVDSYLYVNLNDTPEVRESRGLHWSYSLPGGVLHDYSSHVLYLALYLAGTPVKTQFIKKSCGQLAQGLADHLTISFDGSRCTATAVVSCEGKVGSYGVRVVGERGSGEVNFDSQTVHLKLSSVLPRRISSAFGSFGQGFSLWIQTADNFIKYIKGALVPYHGLRLLIPRFYESIRSRQLPPVSRELALAVTAVEEELFSGLEQPLAMGSYSSSSQTHVRRPAKVLVTGASGYVGQHVVKALVEDGYFVRALCRPISNVQSLANSNIEIFLGDVRNLGDVCAATAGMDTVVHVAAGIEGSPKFVVETCVEGTRNIAVAAQKEGVRRVIYMSSMSIYNSAELLNGEWITEETSLEDHPEHRGAYSLGKRRAEDIALQHLQELTPSWTILRPSLIVGHRRDIFRPIGPKLGNILVSPGRSHKRLLLIHVEDVAAAIVAVLTNERTKNQVYTLSQPEDITVQTYIAACVRPADKSVRVIYFPYLLARLATGVFTILHRLTPKIPSISSRQLASVYQNARASSSLLYAHTGWQPAGALLDRLHTELEGECSNAEVEVRQMPAGQSSYE